MTREALCQPLRFNASVPVETGADGNRRDRVTGEAPRTRRQDAGRSIFGRAIVKVEEAFAERIARGESSKGLQRARHALSGRILL